MSNSELFVQRLKTGPLWEIGTGNKNGILIILNEIKEWKCLEIIKLSTVWLWSDTLHILAKSHCGALCSGFRRHIHKMKQTSVLFRLMPILLLSLGIFTSFHTYLCSHGSVLGVSALSWHLTNMRDGGRITTRVWNRSRSALTIVNSAGSEIARFICDTAVHHSIQSVFLIFHQSELLRTASDNLQQIPAQGIGGLGLELVPQFSFSRNHW